MGAEDARRPTGTVTFLFTDIEGSTRLVRELGQRWHEVLAEHNRLMRDSIREAGGVDLRTEGDAVFAVFQSAPAAVSAAVMAQRRIASASWPEPLRVRMGLHTGEGVPGGDDYVGLDVHRAARIAGAAHGGQVLLSAATRSLIEDTLPPGVAVRALGRHRLKDLPHPEDLNQLVIDMLPSEFPPPRSLETPTNLPDPLASFVGREQEMKRLTDLLARTRILTLTGPGGTGKTRLAVEGARTLLTSHPDGAFFVDLAPIGDPSLVPSTIAVSLGVRTESSRDILESVRDAVRDRQMLLVLDNFEQIAEAAPIVSDLVGAAPGLQVLITSRAALHLRGEQEFPVPPLDLPNLERLPRSDQLLDHGSVALFAHRAAAVDPDFTITDQNARAVAEICARLDGLPLAIELAASRIKLLSPEAILTRLQHRLDVLTGGAGDLPVRQRTLRETIRWSFDLLDEPERLLFSRLGIFVGGWGMEAAEAIANPREEVGVKTLDALASLLDKNLIRRDPDGGEPRFGMLETIREFASEVLEQGGESKEVHRRHASYFLGIVEEAEPHLTGGDQRWLDRLEREHGNLRAALGWSIESQEAEPGLLLAGSLWRFWQLRGHLPEGGRWIRELLATPGAAARTRARARALSASGSLAYWLRDLGSVQEPYEESLAIYQELGDRPGEAESAYNLAFARLVAGDREAAKELFGRAADLYRALGNQLRLAYVKAAVGIVLYQGNELEPARVQLEEASQTFQDARELLGIALTSGELGVVALKQGSHARARAAAIESLEANRNLGNTLGAGVAVEILAVLALREGRAEVAVRLAGAVDRVKDAAGGEAPPEAIGLEDPREVAKGLLGEERVVELLEEGRAMDLDEATSLARGGG